MQVSAEGSPLVDNTETTHFEGELVQVLGPWGRSLLRVLLSFPSQILWTQALSLTLHMDSVKFCATMFITLSYLNAEDNIAGARRSQKNIKQKAIWSKPCLYATKGYSQEA